jgi:RHS repeat-associated protein
LLCHLGNQRTAITNAANQKSLYRYDPIGQLKSASGYSGSEARGYAYDNAWNVSVVTNVGTPQAFTVDGKNQLVSLGSLTFGYDLNGNLTNVSGIGSTNYYYDDEKRLVQANWTANYVTFKYDGLGRLREQISWFTNIYLGGETNSDPRSESLAHGGGGGFTSDSFGGGGSRWQVSSAKYYIYDGNRVIQERNESNVPQVTYTRGSDLSGSLEGAGGIGGLLARTDGGGSAYYHADGNGNITYLETSAQGLGASYRFDPFGNLLTSSGSLAADNTYRFSSKEWIPTLKSYYYLYRFYVPALQRWLNRDPIDEWGGMNLYSFNHNNPICYVDSDGRFIVPIVIVVGLVGWGVWHWWDDIDKNNNTRHKYDNMDYINPDYGNRGVDIHNAGVEAINHSKPIPFSFPNGPGPVITPTTSAGDTAKKVVSSCTFILKHVDKGTNSGLIIK